MARTQFSAAVYDQQNTRELRHVKSRIKRAYEALCKEVGIVGAGTSFSDPDKRFLLSDYPAAAKKVEKLLEGLSGDIQSIITDGVDRAWNLSGDKNSAMVHSLASQYGWSDERANALSRRNLASLERFKARKVAGMTLSDRVWDFVRHDRQKIEWALELGLAEGKSAAALSRDVRQYLVEPDKLFRRVRNKHGQLVLSKAAKAYHPGQGVYRSSYKNALRLAATETNMAYRSADNEAWEQMPFIIGVEIKTSSVHAISDTQGKPYDRPYSDMCDELAGIYPKGFKFTGWHPHCRCYAVAKLASREEMDKYTRLTDEEQKRYRFEGEVHEMPQAYNDWMKANEMRIANAILRGSPLPYFMQDNYVGGDPINGQLLYKWKEEQEAERLRNAVNIEELRDKWLAMAAQRHAARTQDEIDEIQRRWNERLDRVRSSETYEQLKARLGADLPKTLLQYQEALRQYPSRYQDAALLRRQKEVNALMRKLMQDNDYGMEIKHEYLESVFDKGFLNTFQTGKSGGYEGSNKTSGAIEKDHGRLVMAHRMFDPRHRGDISGRTYTGPQLQREEYEKYGHLIDRDKTVAYDENQISQYGDVQVRFKKRDVTPTWTFDDSLSTTGSYYQPSLCSDPQVHSFDDDGVSIAKGDKWGKLAEWQRDHSTRYIELQYHGKLTIDMVESLTFGRNPGDLISADLIDRMMSKGIEIWYRKSGKVIQMKNLRMHNDPEVELTKEALQRFRERGITIWYKDSGGNIVTYDYARLDKKTIAQIAAERHAARTADKEQQLQDFWTRRKAEGAAMRKEIDDIVARSKDITDMRKPVDDVLDLMSGRTGGAVMASGKTATASMEKMRAAITGARKVEDEFNAAIDDVRAAISELAGMKGVEVKKILNAKSIQAAKEGAEQIREFKKAFEYIDTLRLEQQKQLLEQYIAASTYKFANKAMKAKLEVVKTDIRIGELTPEINTIGVTASSSRVAVFKGTVDDAKAALARRDVAEAERLLQAAKDMEAVAAQYDTMMGWNYTTSKKYNDLMADGLDLIGKGDLQGAKDRFDQAAAVKAQNDLNVARRKAREEAARKKAEEEAKRKAEEAAAAAKRKKISDAKSIDDIRKITGSDCPVLLDHYEKSVARHHLTDPDFVKDEAAFSRKMKEYFDTQDFSHCTQYEYLEGYLEKGILTNLQKDAGTSDYECSYNHSRRAYGHFAYGFQRDQSRVPRSEWLRDGDYYRCGVPVDKDKTKAYTQVSGYGPAQIILRKDAVVTTFTYGNSLQEDTIPSLTCDPRVCSLDRKDVKNFRARKYDHDSILEGQHWDESYIELQYLPKRSSEFIGPECFESITLGHHPESIRLKGKKATKAFWKKWADKGVDVYYKDTDGKVKLYMKGKPLETEAERRARLDAAHAARRAKRDADLKKKGLTPAERAQQLIEQRAKDKMAAENYARMMSSQASALANADLGKKEFKIIDDYLAKGNVFGARARAKEIEERLAEYRKELSALHDYIPDAEQWHKKFTLQELKDAHAAISAKFRWLETRYEGRNDPDRLITKLAKEASYSEHPELTKPGATRYPTWEIARNAYNRRRDELIYQYRQDSIDENIARLKAFKTKDKDFKALMTELNKNAKDGRWGNVEDLIVKAKERMLVLGETEETKVLKLGECGIVRFSREEYDQLRKDAAKWFRCPEGKETAAQIKKAFKAADDYMSQYAEEMWSKLTDEEKHILWLYTDGSKYINDEMLGTYSLRLKSWIDKSMRNGLEDANVITSIIEKSPALRDDMWMQSGKSEAAFSAIFGRDIRYTDLNDLVGLEGKSNLFMSCHAARDGAFTKSTSTGSSNNVVLSIYMPKGTKGIYLEPIASYGDSKRGAEGYTWDGTKRKCAPSDQVEFLLQRGAKFRITKAVYDPKKKKWYVDVDLIEQAGQKALDTTIADLDWRSIRYRAPAS